MRRHLADHARSTSIRDNRLRLHDRSRRPPRSRLTYTDEDRDLRPGTHYYYVRDRAGGRQPRLVLADVDRLPTRGRAPADPGSGDSVRWGRCADFSIGLRVATPTNKANRQASPRADFSHRNAPPRRSCTGEAPRTARRSEDPIPDRPSPSPRSLAIRSVPSDRRSTGHSGPSPGALADETARSARRESSMAQGVAAKRIDIHWRTDRDPGGAPAAHPGPFGAHRTPGAPTDSGDGVAGPRP